MGELRGLTTRGCDCAAGHAHGVAGDGRARVRRRRLTALGAVAAVLVGALSATTSPAAAAWQASATVSAPISAATTGAKLEFVSGGGVTNPQQTTYGIGGLLVPSVGYVDVVNTSSVPAQLSSQINMGSLVAGSTVKECSVPWTFAGACDGTTTLIASTALLAVPLVPYAWSTTTAPGARRHLQVAVAGVVVGVTIDISPPVVRLPGDRTFG